MTTTQTEDALDKRAGDIKDAVDRAWQALIDLDIDSKALALDRLADAFALISTPAVSCREQVPTLLRTALNLIVSMCRSVVMLVARRP